VTAPSSPLPTAPMDDSPAPVHSGAPPPETGPRAAEMADSGLLTPGPSATERALVRSPTSALRLLTGLAVTAIGALITWRFANTAAAMNRDWEQVTHLLPAWIRAIPTVMVGLTLLLVPFVVNVQLLRFRRFRLWTVVNLAAIVAFVTSGVLVALMTRNPPSMFPNAYNSVGGSVNDPLLAGFIAAFVVGIPYLPASARRLAGWTVALSFLTTLGFAEVPAIAWVADIGIGITCGAAVALLVGTPDTAPERSDLIEGLARSGIRMTDIAPAAVDARGSTPWLGTTTDGRKVFVKVLNQDNRSAEIMFRVFRALFLRNTGDERPTSSLKRSVEHEALLSLRATAAGIPTPALLTVSDVGNDAMLLAFEGIDGDSLDRLDPDEISNDVLDTVWAQVVQLQAHGIAHRDLRLANIFAARDGGLYLIDFGFAELAASELLLATDLAELLASTAPVVGTTRAVDAAERAVGANGLARAFPRLQPYSLGGATRAALKESGQLSELRAEVERRARIPEPDYRGVVPTSAWPLVAIVAFTVAVGAGLVAVARWDAERVGGPSIAALHDPVQVLGLAGAALFGLAAATTAAIGALRDRVSPRHQVLARLAATWGEALAPFHTGSIAIRVQFLRANGLETDTALGSVGVTVLSRVAAQVAMLYLAVRLSGSDGSIGVTRDIDPALALLAVLGVVATFPIAALPASRRAIGRSVTPAIRAWASGFRALTTAPTRLAQLIVGSVFVPLASVGAMVAADRTFGGTLDPPSIALVVLAVLLVAAFVPMPGGAGIAEAGIVGGLMLLGEQAAVAVPAVFAFRFATFWLPVAAGWASTRWLRGHAQLLS